MPYQEWRAARSPVSCRRPGGRARTEEFATKPAKYPELTASSIVLGALFGAVLNVGICFAGLQIGFTIVGSTVGSIIGFGILRGIMRRRSILEVNIFQTVASSVNTVNAGVIFTVPVLFLLGLKEQIDFPALLLATIAGSLLGVVMIIPLRKQIIDFERLRFPTAVAVAAILKSPGAGVAKAKLLCAGIVLAALVKSLVYWSPLPDDLEVGRWLGAPAGIRLVFAVSLLSLGAGFIAGRPGLAILYGTLLNFWVLIPACILLGWVPENFADFTLNARTAEGVPDYGRANEFNGAFARFTSRNVGIGMILGGAVAGIAIALPALKAALASLRGGSLSGERDEVSFGVLKVGFVVGLVGLFLAAKLSGGGAVGLGTALLVTLAGGIWLWLAGLVVAQTTGRTDWSPLSGLSLIAIAIMMAIMGTGDQFIVPAVTVGAAICVATSMCADMMADLKTGYLIGARPIKQQIAQIGTSWIGPGIALATVWLLWSTYAFGPDQAQTLYDRALEKGPDAVAALEKLGGSPAELQSDVPRLGAPQAAALKAAIEILQGGDVKVGKYLTGALVGLLVSLLVSPGLGVMIGLSLYLPFKYMIVFGIGGVTSILLARWKGARFAEDKGVPLAGGLIVGDALLEVAHAIVKVSTAF